MCTLNWAGFMLKVFPAKATTISPWRNPLSRADLPPTFVRVVERALERHQSKCPSAQSLKASVEICWTAHIEEAA